MSILVGVVIIGLALFCEAFFAGSETGMISTNRIRLTFLADRGDKRAKIIKNFMDNPETFLGTTLVGVNLSVIVASSVASGLVVQSLGGRDYAALVTTLIMLPLILIFGEIIPKAIFRQYADTLSLWSAYPLRVTATILFPLVWLATKLAALTSKVFVKDKVKKNPYVTREEFRLLLGETAKQRMLTRDEIKMAYEIFDFGRTTVCSVMVPLSNVISAPYQSRSEELAGLIAQSGFSRIPIYKDRPEDIVGTIQVSDLITEGTEQKNVPDLIREPYMVPEDKPIDDLLNELKTNQKNIAIVFNREGKAAGIATLEDVVEEIVGEIEDEYDTGTGTC